MLEFQGLWRGLKRLLLSPERNAAASAGEAVVLTGRAAVEVIARRLDIRGSGSRDQLASAVGLVLSGYRATTWLQTQDPALAMAVAQRLPLVCHLALSDAASHAAHRAAVQAGWVVMYPQTVQEAVDLSLVALHLAEHALTPVLVALDGAAIADSAQDLLMPDTASCQRVVGGADDEIAAPTPAQELLFGARRRRLPRYFDLERPSLHGVDDAGLGAASSSAFFDTHLDAQVELSLAQVAVMTGRALGVLHRDLQREPGTDGFLLARGAAVAMAEAVVSRLYLASGIDYQVLGLRCATPGASAAAVEAMGEGATTILLQPAAARLAPEAAWSSLLAGATPSCSAYYDFPEHPLRPVDLLALCREVHEGRRGEVCLGLSFLPEASDYPKRQVLLDTLRRDYGEVAELGLRGVVPIDLRGPGATTIAVNRSASVGGEELAPGLAGLLAAVPGLTVRSRFATGAPAYGAASFDLVSHGGKTMADPGTTAPADVLVLLYASLPAALELSPGVSVVVPLSGDEGLSALPAATLRALHERSARLFVIDTAFDSAPHESPLPESVLGAVCGALQARGLDLPTRRAVQTRQAALAGVDEAARQALLAEFERGVSALLPVDWADVEVPTAASVDEDISVPAAIRHLQASDLETDAETGQALGGGFDSVPRFWDQVGVLYRHGQEGSLSPDPFQATGCLPPLTASFHDLSRRRRTIRVFEPEACTGCGECWTVCPDSALGPVACGFEDLLGAGMQAAKAAGDNADALRPLLGKLAARARKQMGEVAGATALGSVLREAFDYVLAKAAPASDRQQALQAAFDAVHAQVDGFPIAQTEPFFAHGELLSIAVHVEACKACGSCTEVCPTGAINGVPQTPERIASARKNWRLFERLPDAAEQTIARVAADPEVGRAAATLLDQHCMFSLSGGDTAEPGSGEKIAVHLALAAAEQELQPRLQQHLVKVTELQDQCRQRIRELLAAGLPTGDLAGLEASLQQLEGRHLDLAELAGTTGTEHPVDAELLRSLVHTARQLGELGHRLRVGHNGLGRARIGMLVAPGTVQNWAAAFPYNPFPVPVLLDRAGASAELARGLCLGQVEAILEDVRLLRRAGLELDRPAAAKQASAELAALSWDQLSDAERELCPPLLLIGGDDGLGQRGLAEMSPVLSGDLPIKLLVLAGLDLGLQDTSGLGRSGAAGDIPQFDIGLLAMAHRRAFVAQSSIGDADHLVESCLGAFRHPGPALLHVHAPSPQRHGFATHQTRAQAQLALAAGVLPRFTYDPGVTGLFGLRLSLQGETDPTLTTADFCASENRFAHHFGVLEAAAPEPMPVAEYLKLAPAQRGQATPCVEIDGRRWRVSQAMVAACEDRQHALAVLRELAGDETPFTVKVQAEAEARTASGHRDELAELRAEYEARFASLRGELQQEFTIRLRDRLVALAARHRAQPVTAELPVDLEGGGRL